ncbi:MAG: 16S rRNA (guanine(527)-N(7))-methyltransferase RsmG [Planctomycetota bacterium]
MTTPDETPELLADAVAACELEISTAQLRKLDAYRGLLWEWNEKLNLTRHTTIEKFVTRDLVDTIELAKLLPEGQRVLDVGSGGGVPGLPLSILRPDLDVHVCESVGKKANVLADMVVSLDLRATVYSARVETIVDAKSDAPHFDTLVARAVAPLWKFMFWLRPHHQGWDQLILIKGPSWPDERGEARHRGLMKGYQLRRLAEYTTPRTEAITTVLGITRVPPKPQKGPKRR